MDLQELLNSVKGKTAGQITDMVKEYVTEQKEQLDKETRRKVRAFWLCVLAAVVVVEGICFYAFYNM